MHGKLFQSLPNGDLIFHRNFTSNQSLTLKVKQLPVFCEELVKCWEGISFQPNSPDLILSESIWFNRFVSVEKKAIIFKDFFMIGINKIGDLYENDGKLIHFDKLSQLGLLSELYFQWMQLIDTLPVKWKELSRNNPSPINQAVSKYTLYLQETPTAITLPLTCKALYAKLIKQTQTKPTSQPYWEQSIRNADDEYHPHEITIDWKKIYLIPRRPTIESYTRSFQYKIINNALFLNKKLFNMRYVESPACSFCNQDDESLIHFFCECHVTRKLWKDLQKFFATSLRLPELNLKNALFGYVPVTTSNSNKKQVTNLSIISF